MRWPLFIPLVVVLGFAACKSPSSRSAAGGGALPTYQKRAADYGTWLSVPPFEKTPDEIRGSMKGAIARADSALDRMGALEAGEVDFDNTLRALDDLVYEAMLAANRLYLIKETSPEPEMREAATEMVKVFDEWAVGLDYREDVYRAVKAFADSKRPLAGERARLLEETLRDYKRAGLHLPQAERAEVEALRKKLTGLTTDFQTNVTEAKAPLKFTGAQLKGVPESFLGAPGVKTGEDEYTVMANITFHFLAVMQNCSVEATRKKLKLARYTLAQEVNAPLLQQIVELRDTIAGKLGYASWADYKTEPKMAGTAQRALAFEKDLAGGLQPKFDAEIEAFQKLKAAETGNADAQIRLWDWRYYSNQLKKTRYAVDAEQLRVFFPYEATLNGMFRTYEHCFGLKIREIEAPYKWVPDVTLHLVSDSATGQPLGMVYLDMFPRDGKYNHFAQFDLIPGKRLPDGVYQRPTVALICNFPAPQPDKPSLLLHNEVETLFHEFGHALHSILTQAEFHRFSGTSVPRDFVEAPSQMLERWVWDKQVLDSFAADYRDPSRKIPQEILDQMDAARKATIGTFYRRQLSFGLLDLALHSEISEQNDQNCVELSNQILSDVFLPVPEGTTFVTYFGHLMGYDAGYYGYAWADAIAADMATVFEGAPQGYFDQQAGMRLRREIYAPGNSRDVAISIRRFLGRERSLKPFLKEIGIE